MSRGRFTCGQIELSTSAAPHPWSSTFSAAVDSSAPHYGAWYRVSGTERVAVGCAAQTRYPRTRTYLKSHRVAGAENRSKRSEQEALVELIPWARRRSRY